MAYFKSFKTDLIYAYLNFDYNRIEDWDETFETKEGKVIKPTKSIIDIFEELFNLYMYDFHYHNEYDYDEYWTLEVRIYTKENRINFQSECKYQNEDDVRYDIDLTSSDEMSRTGDKRTLPKSLLDKIEKVFNSEVEEEDERVEFDFGGSYNEIDIVDHIEVDGQLYNVRKQPWSDLLDDIMTELIDRWWSDGPGVDGTIKFTRNDSIEIDVIFKSEDWESSPMNINVTPDNVK